MAEVLRACLIEGLCDPVVEPLDSELPDHSEELDRQPCEEAVLGDADRGTCASGSTPLSKATRRLWAGGSPSRTGATIHSGTEIVRQINDQLIKWCEAFLDEGHATWAMPDREKGHVPRLENDRRS